VEQHTTFGVAIFLHRGDNDKKYPQPLDDEFTTPTCKVKWNVPALLNLQSPAMRVVQALKHEVLNAFRVERKALDHILDGANWYNHRR